MEGVVDVDTHIAEPEAMWTLIDEKMMPRRPVLLGLPDDTWFGDRNALWLIDGNIFPKPAGKGSYRLVTPSAQKAEKVRGDIAISSREISDVPARVKDMDRLGVDVQVIYPTLFLVYLTDDAELETALCKAYNSWLSDACNKSNGRLKFVAILPLRSIPESLKEMKRAKDLGAVGIFFRGIEGDKTIDHPYFHSVYEQAAQLDMPICIHTGSGAPWMLPYFEHARNHTFAHGRALPIFAFRDLVANRIPEKFPGLRIGFIEASAGWAPFMIHILRGLFKDRPKFKNSAELFATIICLSPAKPTKTFRIWPNASAKTTSSSVRITATTIRPPRKNWSRPSAPARTCRKGWRKRSWCTTRADCTDCNKRRFSPRSARRC
jgi:predicted TIM-barrel fold metal-dependent hydrolase